MEVQSHIDTFNQGANIGSSVSIEYNTMNGTCHNARGHKRKAGDEEDINVESTTTDRRPRKRRKQERLQSKAIKSDNFTMIEQSTATTRLVEDECRANGDDGEGRS